MTVFPACAHLCRSNAGFCPRRPFAVRRTGADRGRRVQSHFMAPQVQSSVMATPQVSVNTLSRALCVLQPCYSPPLVHSLQSGAVVRRREGHCSMMSLRFSCSMVSLTAWKTKRMFSVSMAVVKWWKSGLPRFLRLRLNDCTRNAYEKHSGLSVSFKSHFLNIIYTKGEKIWFSNLGEGIR